MNSDLPLMKVEKGQVKPKEKDKMIKMIKNI